MENKNYEKRTEELRNILKGKRVKGPFYKDHSLDNEEDDIEKFSIENVRLLIIEECDAIKNLLIEKNKSYGNSAIVPKRIFSSSSPIEQIKVRIDDKLSRLASKHSSTNEDIVSEDTVKDLMGYLILLRVAQRLYASEPTE